MINVEIKRGENKRPCTPISIEPKRGSGLRRHPLGSRTATALEPLIDVALVNSVPQRAQRSRPRARSHSQ